MELKTLVSSIQSINTALRDNAAKAINKSVTARNWLIGYYIVNYEQHGEDRALYGERILQAFPELFCCIAHYLLESHPIGQPLVAQLQIPENKINTILQPAVAKLETSFVGHVEKQ